MLPAICADSGLGAEAELRAKLVQSIDSVLILAASVCPEFLGGSHVPGVVPNLRVPLHPPDCESAVQRLPDVSGVSEVDWCCAVLQILDALIAKAPAASALRQQLASIVQVVKENGFPSFDAAQDAILSAIAAAPRKLVHEQRRYYMSLSAPLRAWWSEVERAATLHATGADPPAEVDALRVMSAHRERALVDPPHPSRSFIPPVTTQRSASEVPSGALPHSASAGSSGSLSAAEAADLEAVLLTLPPDVSVAVAESVATQRPHVVTQCDRSSVSVQLALLDAQLQRELAATFGVKLRDSVPAPQKRPSVRPVKSVRRRSKA